MTQEALVVPDENDNQFLPDAEGGSDEEDNISPAVRALMQKYDCSPSRQMFVLILIGLKPLDDATSLSRS